MSDINAPILKNRIWAYGTGPQNSNNMPFPILGAIGAGVSLGSNIFNAVSQNRANKRAYQQQVDLWNMNNSYNHPSAQMARLREAGLNPNLVYGQGVKGATGASSPAGTPPVQAPELRGNPIMEYQNLRGTELQYDNQRQQNTLLRQEQLIKTLEMANKNENLKKSKTFNEYFESQLEAQLIKQQSDANMAQIKSQLLSKEWDLIMQMPATYDRYLMQAWDLRDAQLTNAQKLAKLRDLEVQIKTDLKDFTTSNQFVNILAKIANIIK